MEIKFLENDEIKKEIIIKNLALIFDEFIKNNIKIEEQQYFMEKEILNITVKKYLLRINKYLNPSYSIFIILPFIIDKILLNKKYNIKINKYNIHYLIIVCMVIIIKYYEDIIYNNAFCAEIGGLTLDKLNTYEILVLKIIDYDLNISNYEYEKYMDYLLNI